MKHWLATSMLCMLFMTAYSQGESVFKRHSYSEFLQLIQEETDTLFEYSDAIIEYDPETDERFSLVYQIKDSVWTEQAVDTIVIDKYLKLRNVHFISSETGPSEINGVPATRMVGVWYKCRFNGQLDIEKSVSLRIFNSSINSHLSIINRVDFSLQQTLEAEMREMVIEFQNNRIFKDFNIRSLWTEDINPSTISITANEFDIQEHRGTLAFSVAVDKPFRFNINRNKISSLAPNDIRTESARWVNIEDNTFTRYITIDLNEFYGFKRLKLNRNSFSDYVLINLPLEIPPSAFIGWKQFEGQLISNNGFGPYVSDLFVNNRSYLEANRYSSDFFKAYYDSIRITNSDAFVGEMSLRGRLYNHHRAKYDYEAANQVFIDLKNLETERLTYLYRQNSTFKTYFKWKINQFLKLFVDYGTEPAKAIVFAVYVIAFFAAIYLFFPNSWDGHGRTRIMDRLRFFLKYSKQEEGVREVYLEEKKAELIPFEEFRDYFKEHRKKAPGFFYALAMPLYKWSVSGTRLTSGLLGRIDVLGGTWEKTPQSKRWLKASLVIGAFLLALVYDLFIKVLNAIMLSINTFTTLGFGEIPIKGLPRYLAIIQGFIGWFMLTIFSVSLISQLLN